MTEFEDTYRRLVSLGPPLRKQWLLDHQPPTVSPAHWWLALIESAAGDVRSQRRGWPVTRPRADLALAASLIEWALEQKFPPELAIGRLVELTTMALTAGDKIEHLPVGIRPDSIARQAVNSFTMTRQEAINRAARLRAIPVTDGDFFKPGDDIAVVLPAISQTDDYRDYHQLLNITRMLTDLAPLVDLITDAELAARTHAWLNTLPSLDPFPAGVSSPPRQNPPEPRQGEKSP